MRLWWLLVSGLTLVVDPTSGVAVFTVYVVALILLELGVPRVIWVWVAGLWTGCCMVFFGWMGLHSVAYRAKSNRRKRRPTSVLSHRASKLRSLGFRVVDVHNRTAASSYLPGFDGRRSQTAQNNSVQPVATPSAESNRPEYGCAGRYLTVSLHHPDGARPGPRSVRLVLGDTHGCSGDSRPESARPVRRFPRSRR